MMRTVRLPDGTEVPALGQGTWHMGERGSAAKAEVAALKLGIELGHDADRHRRDVRQRRRRGGGGRSRRRASATGCSSSARCIRTMPRARGVPAACERSLKRLRTDRIDLYLLHWRGSHPLAETVEAFEALRAAGRSATGACRTSTRATCRNWCGCRAARNCASNQVLYHPGSRGIEYDLLPWCTEHKIPMMAYSPLGQGGRLLRSKALAAVAKRHNATPAQIAIAWSHAARAT